MTITLSEPAGPDEAMRLGSRAVRSPTPRQYRVLELLADGYETKEIAWTLRVGAPAVKKHVARLKIRYGAANRTAMVIAAIRSGDLLVTPAGVADGRRAFGER